MNEVDHPVWVRNISAGGAAVQADLNLNIATAVSLDIPVHGLFRCFVIWSDAGLHGLAFQDSADSVISRFAANAISLGMVEP